MANHVTPEELAKEVGTTPDEVIRVCLEEHIPLRSMGGRVDKTLFKAHVHSYGLKLAPVEQLATA